MEDNKNGGYSAEGRKLRPRKKVSFAEGEGRQEGGYGHSNYGEHRSYGDRKPYSGGPRKPYGDRPQGGHGGYGKPYGERRPYGEGSDQRSNFSSEGGERRSYGDGERRPYNSEHKPYNSEHRPYGGGEHRSYGDRKPYGGQRKPYGDRPQGGRGGYGKPYGERRPYGEGSDQRSNFSSDGGERRSYGEGGERRPYNNGEHRNYEHRNYGEGGQRPYGGQRKPYGDRPQGGRGGYGKPYGERRNFSEGGRGGYGRPQGGYHKRYEPQFDESEESGINKMLSRKPQLDAAQYSDNDYVQAPFQEEIRLNKFIANSGVCSRREADTFIQAGVVTVNGEVVTELGTKVNVINDDVRFNGERLKGEEKVYIVMNKPKGFVTTSSDPHADKTVMDLLSGCEARVFPVGRLDKATTGVLMFTNDGEMAERLTHPSYDKKKIYQVILDHDLTQEDYDKILSGVSLTDGEVKADELEYIDAEDHRRLGIEIHSGKNRIVRRIFESLGYDVKALDRVYFAGLTKKGLTKGEWRYLTEGEVNILKMGAYV